MKKKHTISMSVIRRLPRYYRYLGDLKSRGLLRISSRELSEKMGVTASQIRQDLNHFGEFGQQGYGYNVALLYDEICKILGINKKHKTILIGAGNLGKAIANHMDFINWGYDLIGIFDNREEVIGKNIIGLEIKSSKDIPKFCKEFKPEAAVLCIPKQSVQSMVRELINFGIKGFWNFSAADIQLENDSNVVIENVHLGDSLAILCYRLKNL